MRRPCDRNLCNISRRSSDPPNITTLPVDMGPRGEPATPRSLPTKSYLETEKTVQGNSPNGSKHSLRNKRSKPTNSKQATWTKRKYEMHELLVPYTDDELVTPKAQIANLANALSFLFQVLVMKVNGSW